MSNLFKSIKIWIVLFLIPAMIVAGISIYKSSNTKLLDKEEYIQSTLWKLDKYIRAGIYPNRDLLLTVEEPNTGLDMEKLNQMIDCFFF